MMAKKSLLDEDSDRQSVSFPHVFPIAMSHSELPCSYKSMNESGLPFGCIVTPFITNDEECLSKVITTSVQRVARCENCAAYINPYCDANNQRWFCSLCMHRNSFTRSQARYRQTELKSLPEIRNPIMDYRMPIREAVGNSSNAVDCLSAQERPLVHLFLVQESMKLDAMQSVIESLSQTVGCMHPDIQVVLMTFSHRVGIYSFSEETAVPTVQYVHFTLPSVEGQSSILEGHDMHELQQAKNAELMLPLNDVASFLNTATRIGSCSNAFSAVMTSLFDAFPAESRFANNDARLPKVMLGPVLQAVTDWVLDAPAELGDAFSEVLQQEDFFDDSAADRGIGSTLQEGLVQVFSKLGLGGGWGRSGERGAGSKGQQAVGDILDRSNPHNCPIDLCSGVLLHVFMDSPQDLPVGSHESVATASSSGTKGIVSPPTRLDSEWVDQLAHRCAEKSLTVNLWPVTSFDGEELGLGALEPLVHLTGGSICRTVLGFYPKDERERLTEMLRRSLNCAYATRCLLKLRASPIVDFLEECSTGSMLSDKQFPGVYRVASCNPERAFGFEFAYKQHMELNNRNHDRENVVVFQMAFSYETLVESIAQPSNSSSTDTLHSSDELLAMGLGGEGDEAERAALKSYLSDTSNASSESYFASVMTVLELDKLNLFCAQQENGSQRRKNVRGRETSNSRNCPYDKTRKLVAVKFLRVVSLAVECTPKLMRLYQACNIPTTVALLTRKAVAANSKFFLEHGAAQSATAISAVSDASKDNVLARVSASNPAVSMLTNFAVRLLVRFIKCNLGMSKKTGHDVAAAYAEFLAGTTVDTVLSELLATNPLTSELSVLVFAVIDLLEKHLAKSTELRSCCDDLVELSHLVLIADPLNLQRVLYPRLIPLSCADLMLDKHSIPLSRTAMLTSGNAFKYFLLDTGTDLVLYKSLMTAAPSTSSTSAGVSGGVDAADLIASLSSIFSGSNSEMADQAQSNPRDEAKDAAIKVLHHVSQQDFFIINYLRRRIQCSPAVPRVYLCDAGTQSSSYFTAHLLEERSRSGVLELSQFKQLVADIVKTAGSK